LVGSDEFDFFAILGDVFYDTTGAVVSEFFDHLSVAAKAKPFFAVVGNHDFWQNGAPPGVATDLLGYSFPQFFGQDTVAATDARPYDFAGYPSMRQIARAENFIYGSQLGDLAFFSYSAAHDWIDTEPHVAQFCRFVGSTQSVNAVILLGHWDECNLGCRPGMDTPAVYEKMKAMSGCDVKRLLYFMGHQHCNRIASNSSGPLDAYGFMIGGTGMYGWGCSQFGFTVLRSNPSTAGGPNVRVDHFPLAEDRIGKVNGKAKVTGVKYDNFDQVFQCLNQSGYAACRATHGLSFRAESKGDIVTPGPGRYSHRMMTSAVTQLASSRSRSNPWLSATMHRHASRIGPAAVLSGTFFLVSLLVFMSRRTRKRIVPANLSLLVPQIEPELELHH